MARPSVLTDEEVDAWLGNHQAWHRDGLFLKRSIEFSNFVEAFGFMTQVAIVSEKMDHHPEWFNVYNKVDISITTHDVGGLSENDLSFCEAVDAIAPPG